MPDTQVNLSHKCYLLAANSKSSTVSIDTFSQITFVQLVTQTEGYDNKNTSFPPQSKGFLTNSPGCDLKILARTYKFKFKFKRALLAQSSGTNGA